MSDQAKHDRPLTKPPWLKVRLGGGEQYTRIQRLVSEGRLHTVCESASCPNRGECWDAGTATLMILGNTCTRDCRFCDVPTGLPAPPDDSEPARVAEAVATMKLRHVVITSVNRDDLTDGGGRIWGETVHAIRRRCLLTAIEVLPGDFAGRLESCKPLLDARPDVFGHNIEVVPRLYPLARPQGDYQRSLQVLRWAKRAGLLTKSSLMLGLGESADEVHAALADLREAGVSIVAMGQYLQPSPNHVPIVRYVTPEEFETHERVAKEMGFDSVAAGPLVRSSYHAERYTRLKDR